MNDEILNIKTEGLIFTYNDERHQYYQPTYWEVLDIIADKGYISKDSHVIDYGCGKGRVAFYLNHEIGCKVTGIEFATEIYNMAVDNLNRYGYNRGVSFVNANAEEYDVTGADTFYLFNPFSAETFQKCLDKILANSNSKRLILFWVLPSYQQILDSTPRLKLIEEVNCDYITPYICEFNKIAVYDIA